MLWFYSLITALRTALCEGIRYQAKTNKMPKTWYPGCATGRLLSAPLSSQGRLSTIVLSYHCFPKQSICSIRSSFSDPSIISELPLSYYGHSEYLALKDFHPRLVRAWSLSMFLPDLCEKTGSWCFHIYHSLPVTTATKCAAQSGTMKLQSMHRTGNQSVEGVLIVSYHLKVDI